MKTWTWLLKYYFLGIFIFLILFESAYGQESKNPSLVTYTEDFPWYEFNVVSRDAKIIESDHIHAKSWQVTIDNNLQYREDGNAVLRLYDAEISEKFIEIGMGGPPNEKFWIAVQLPEEGYVVVHNKLERGWIPETKVIASYTDQAGLTVNNGERIVLTNLDIDVFSIKSYSTHGLEGSTDDAGVFSGSMNVEYLSGDPTQSFLHLFPFYVTAAIGIIAAIAFLTKKRAS